MSLSRKRQNSYPKNPNRENLSDRQEALIATVSRLFNLNAFFHERIGVLGSVVDFQSEMGKIGGKSSVFRSRERLWKEIVMSSRESEKSIVEFGVAWGYVSYFWYKHFSHVQMSWWGYDRFTGLPTAWGELEKGSFSNAGLVPQPIDSRVMFVKGDVEITVTTKNLNFLQSANQIIAIFDLDLFMPSLHVYNSISGYLKEGDVIYLDEGRMPDERLLIRNYIARDFKISTIGTTMNSVAFEITERRFDVEESTNTQTTSPDNSGN